MRYGYARCSTNESKQDIDRQVRELKAAGAEDIILEYEHGDASEKKQLAQLMDRLDAGDSLITMEVSRLSRSTKQLCDIIDAIKAKRVKLVIVGSVTVDCTGGEMDAMTQAFLQMAGVFAELELSMIRARITSGMANAKAKGKRIGRPIMTKERIPDVFFKHYPAHKRGELNKAELARLCKMSRTTLYKYLEMVEGTKEKLPHRV